MIVKSQRDCGPVDMNAMASGGYDKCAEKTALKSNDVFGSDSLSHRLYPEKSVLVNIVDSRGVYYAGSVCRYQ